MRVNRKRMRPHLPLLIALTAALAIGAPSPAAAQQKITAKVRPAPAPAWNKGIKPVDAESYYNAIECGKQGGDNPACVFWDSGLCANTDYTLAWYTGYKQVAYEVWMAVQRKQKPPQPNFQAAQRQRVTIAVTQAKGASNPLKDLVVTRGGQPATTFERALSGGGGRFTTGLGGTGGGGGVAGAGGAIRSTNIGAASCSALCTAGTCSAAQPASPCSAAIATTTARRWPGVTSTVVFASGNWPSDGGSGARVTTGEASMRGAGDANTNDSHFDENRRAPTPGAIVSRYPRGP